ncbi:MAG: nucleotidyl transferase AbiEii/AbiGii toxin family protein [Parvularculaceae bacterium]
MSRFSPKLDILPAPQRRLWEELGATPEAFTLYGGTAIALRLGHRQSVDFDFFARRRFDIDALLERLPYASEAAIVQRQPDTLTLRLNRDGAVLVSFFATPRLGEVESPDRADDTGLRVASLTDLAAFKTVVVQKRAEAKDFADLDALISAGVDLSTALAAALIVQGPSFNPHISLKALAYFEDGNLPTLDANVKRRLQTAVRNVDVNRLPELTYNRPYDSGEAT